jgi:hypothetical protein
MTRQESTNCPIGQTAHPEAAIRNWISSSTAADGRPFDRLQNGLLQNFPGWQIIVGREFALAIPMATLQLPR